MTLSPIDSCLYMFSGIVWSSIGGVGNNCSCVSQDSPQPPTFPCDGTVIPIVPIINPATGKTWMDRNLGASQVASSSADEDAYGDLYQWGRCSDGHEKRSSVTTTTLSTTETPGHSDFILAPDSPNDWRSPQNNNLWQGVNGTNNPCPTGWRIPTETEWDEERASWTSNDAAGAFATPLKLVVSGSRSHSNGNIGNDGSRGFYWSSTISGTFARYHYFITDGVAGMSNNRRAAGYVVRCIKD